MGADLVSLFLSVYRSRSLKNNFDEGLSYAVFAVLGCCALHWASDRTFSTLITLGAAFQCLGFCLLRLKIRKQKGVQGISSRTLQMFVVAYVCRLYSTLQYNGYLPVDRSGDWMYQLVDVVALLVICSILFAMHGFPRALSRTYEKEMDSCQIMWLLVTCCALSYAIHPHLNNRQIPDMMWTMSLYVEAVAMVPQLFMLTKKGGVVESLASHYIAAVFIARCLYLSFWCNSYGELKPKNADVNLPGWGVIGAQVLQVIIFGDFMIHYFRSMRDNAKLVLPTSKSYAI